MEIHYLLSFILLFISRTTFLPRLWVTVQRYKKFEREQLLSISIFICLIYWNAPFGSDHLLLIFIPSPGHISIRADTKSPVTCYYNIGGVRNEPWHVFWTRQAGVFKYIPAPAQSPFTLNVASIIVTDSPNYRAHLWLMICISICICSRHWVGANYMSHIVLKEPN